MQMRMKLKRLRSRHIFYTCKKCKRSDNLYLLEGKLCKSCYVPPKIEWSERPIKDQVMHEKIPAILKAKSLLYSEAEDVGLGWTRVIKKVELSLSMIDRALHGNANALYQKKAAREVVNALNSKKWFAQKKEIFREIESVKAETKTAQKLFFSECESRGISRQALAIDIGITPVQISRYLRGITGIIGQQRVNKIINEKLG